MRKNFLTIATIGLLGLSTIGGAFAATPEEVAQAKVECKTVGLPCPTPGVDFTVAELRDIRADVAANNDPAGTLGALDAAIEEAEAPPPALPPVGNPPNEGTSQASPS